MSEGSAELATIAVSGFPGVGKSLARQYLIEHGVPEDLVLEMHVQPHEPELGPYEIIVRTSLDFLHMKRQGYPNGLILIWIAASPDAVTRWTKRYSGYTRAGYDPVAIRQQRQQTVNNTGSMAGLKLNMSTVARGWRTGLYLGLGERQYVGDLGRPLGLAQSTQGAAVLKVSDDFL